MRARDTLSVSPCFVVYVIVISYYQWLNGCVPLRSQFLFAADSTKVRRSENNDGTVKHEQKRDSGEDNLQTSPKTTKSSKTVEVRGNDVNFKHVQLWDPWDTSSLPKSSWQAVGEPDAPTWKLSGTQGTSAFWENRKHQCLPKKRVCDKIHPKQHGPFPDRLKLPYPDEEILSRYEEDVSYIRDGFTTRVKADFETVLERHVVDVRKARAKCREASAGRHDISS